jgi:hypothetical protein
MTVFGELPPDCGPVCGRLESSNAAADERRLSSRLARRDACCVSAQPKILGRFGFFVTKEYAEDQITRTLA